MPTGHGSREPWTHREEEIVCRFYDRGVETVADLLPNRTVAAIQLRAVRLGVAATTPAGLRQPCAGEDRDAILALHDQGMGYEPIARLLGLGAQAVSNAILFAQCERAGYTPAQRDATGGLLAQETQRLYDLIRQGLPNVEIQRRMAVSAGCVSHYRRRLKKTGEIVPPTGQHIDYTGTRHSPDVRRQIVAHFMAGYGAAKVAELAGVAKTFATKQRRILVAGLAKKGETLPGCDVTGRRVAVKESASFIPDQQKIDLQWLWLHGWPVAPAADHLGISKSSAYQIIQRLKDELRAQGKPYPKALPPDRRLPLGHKPTPKARPIPPRPAPPPVQPFPALQKAPVIMATFPTTPKPALPTIRHTPAPPKRPLSLEEQLARIAAGARLIPTFKPTRQITDATLGGVGSSLL